MQTTGPFDGSIGGGRTLSASGGSWPTTIVPNFLAIDNSGTVYTPLFYANASPGAPDSVAELGIWSGTSSCSFCGPTASLTGAPFTTHAVTGITLDPAGNVYVVNTFSNVVTEFARSTVAGATVGTNNAAVLRTLSNNAAAIPGSTGMAIGP